MSKHRFTDPVYLQYIWDALDFLLQLNESRSFDSLLNFIRSDRDSKCDVNKLQSELSNAIKDGCISIKGNDYFCTGIVSNIEKTKHDWYCFECHAPGYTVKCPTCFRVLHKNCIETANESQKQNIIAAERDDDNLTDNDSLVFYRESPLNGPCPVCIINSKVQLSSDQSKDLAKLLSTLYERLKCKPTWRLLNHIGYINEIARNDYLVFNEMNTKLVSKRLKLSPTQGGYSSRSQILFDIDILVHNTAIIYGSKADMCNSARQVRTILRKELQESSLCTDCYLNSDLTNKNNRVTLACRKPHKLVWYQHNGWSFWPFKVLSEDANGYEVVSFGGRHDRNYVPKDRTTDFSFSLAHDFGLRMTPALRKALDEVKDYQANQTRFNEQLAKGLEPTAEVLRSFVTNSKSVNNIKNKQDNSASRNPSFDKFQQSEDEFSSIPAYSPLSTEFNRITQQASIPVSNSEFADGCGSSSVSNSSATIPGSSNITRKSGFVNNLKEAPSYHRDRRKSRKTLKQAEPLKKKHSSKKSLNPFIQAAQSENLSDSCSLSSLSPVYAKDPTHKVVTDSSCQLSDCDDPEFPIKTKNKNAKSPRKRQSNKRSRCSNNSDSVSKRTKVLSPRTKSLASNSMKSPLNPLPTPENSETCNLIFAAASQAACSYATFWTRPPTETTLVNQKSSEFKTKPQTTVVYDSDDSDAHSSCSDTNSNHSSSSSTSSNLNVQRRFSSEHIEPSGLASVISNNVSSNSIRMKIGTGLSHNSAPLSNAPSTSSANTSACSGADSGFSSYPSMGSVGTNFSAMSPVPPASKNPKIATVLPSTIGIHSPKFACSGNVSKSMINGSSVSPAALSSASSSGLGSSLCGDPKSVDASPGVTLGIAHPIQAVNNSLVASTTQLLSTMASTLPIQSPEARLRRELEEMIHAEYAEKISRLSRDREEALEEVRRLERLIHDIQRKHETEVRATKQRSWCHVCLKEAFYHCCAGVSYCSQSCQLDHWTAQHSRECRRSNVSNNTATASR